jgi:protein phosphatase
MEIKIPDFCIVALVGVSGSGKSTFAKAHFKTTETLSSDYFRSLVSDDENDQSVTKDAFEILHEAAGRRLKNHKLTVVDATNVQSEARKPILELAKKYHCFAVAIVLDLPEGTALKRNLGRANRNFGSKVIARQSQDLKRTIKNLKAEGFRYIYVLNSEEEINSAIIRREKLWTDKKDETGPFDIIGDIHGCYDELLLLLGKLGYQVQTSGIGQAPAAVLPPAGRRLIFLGDLCDRGPKTPEVIKLVRHLVKFNGALCVAGNHDVKLVKYLSGRNVKMTHGLQESADQLSKLPEDQKKDIKDFLDGLISHFVLDDGKLVVAHAGLKEEFHGRSSGAVREFSLYGETTGEIDEYGQPVRSNWARDYRGKPLVVFGHTPVLEAEFFNNTICLDTGCVFGGELTALRYPERELISVKSLKTYYEPTRPTLAPEKSDLRSMLKIGDVVIKKLRIHTELKGNIQFEKENAQAALEVMSRYSLDPRWLIYLPPTMAPTDVSLLWGDSVGTVYDGVDDKAFTKYLEYPTEAFHYYKKNGIKSVVLEEKHMGSRAVFIICKDKTVPKKRFKIEEESLGVIYTRTGRPFFDDDLLKNEVLAQFKLSLDEVGFWEKFDTDWCCFDAEIMPWSFKALELLRTQYASVAVAAKPAIEMAKSAFDKFLDRKLTQDKSEFNKFQEYLSESGQMISDYQRAYRKYCWSFNSIEDLKIAPFHLLATEGQTHFNHSHQWHMTLIQEICKTNSKFFKATEFLILNLNETGSFEAGVDWWLKKTAEGSEGAVVKSLEFIPRGEGGRLLQPMIKCRGRDYLRIIYGPNYLSEHRLQGLQNRSVDWKRRLALSEFALGVESLKRFVKGEPLYKIHECVFGILAAESEPVDPRL